MTKTACESSGNITEDHFVDVNKMVSAKDTVFPGIRQLK